MKEQKMADAPLVTPDFLEIFATVAVATDCRDSTLTSACLMPINPQNVIYYPFN